MDSKMDSFNEFTRHLNTICGLKHKGSKKRLTLLFKKANNESVKKAMQNNKNTKKIELLQQIGQDYVDKFDICHDIVEYFNKEHSLDPIISGSFIRNIFELPFMLQNIDKNDDDKFGNPIDHDLDIIMYEDQPYNYKDFIKAMNEINKFRDDVKFGSYKINDIVDVTITDSKPNDAIGRISMKNIPHYQIQLVNDKDKYIMIDILAWRPDTNGFNYDFDCNTLSLVDRYISTNTSRTTLLKIIRNIKNRQVHNLYRFSSSENRVSILKQYCYYLARRLKILDNGYTNITGSLPDYTMEEEDLCPVTLCDPPYVNLHLECGHTLSLLGLMSILNSDQPNLKCTLCEESLKIKIIKRISNEPETKPWWETIKQKLQSKQKMKNMIEKQNKETKDLTDQMMELMINQSAKKIDKKNSDLIDDDNEISFNPYKSNNKNYVEIPLVAKRRNLDDLFDDSDEEIDEFNDKSSIRKGRINNGNKKPSYVG